MNSSASEQRLSEAHGSVALIPETGVDTDWLPRIMAWLEKFLLVLVIGGLLAGIGVASISQPVVDRVDATINAFMAVYSYVAPVAIFLILAPSLARLFTTKTMGKFGLFVISWFAIRKVLAGLWAIIFVFILFQLPFLPQGSVSLGDGIMQTLDSLGELALTSTYFWAMYAAVAVSVISIKIERVTAALEKMMNFVEQAGSFLLPVMPIFMFGIGAYIYGLPANVEAQIALDAEGTSALFDLNIWGWAISPHTSGGMITIYVIGALLTAIACFIWQFAFLIIAQREEPRFSIIGYFRNYWAKVYPLLWATSSEALATPLNLYLTKRYAPWIRNEIRRFALGVGSYMDINGTIINVFILGTIVLLMLGLQVSVIELLFIVSVVFLISYGVPGIPGELVLFAGPIATMLNIEGPMLPVFLAVYIGIQLGLPDSFRTGSNSTDHFVQAVLVNGVYEKRFADPNDVAAAERLPAADIPVS